MDNLELLKRAADAAGLYVTDDPEVTGSNRDADCIWVKDHKYGMYRRWNPLDDDGDAFRLAIALRISLMTSSNNTACDVPGTDDYVWEEDTDTAAARRAIVRAAAYVGKIMRRLSDVHMISKA
ncbi:hypothetical protein [Pseudomonas sp. p1(2021b)]|uniref:hypothetical protein n=1 Tax=Pseudomonas sp. p1(2021b) TaxID=2874628 RepID=UPI003D28ADBF